MNPALAIDGGKSVRLSILAVVVIAHAVLILLLVTLRFEQSVREDRSPFVVKVIELPRIPPPPPPPPELMVARPASPPPPSLLTAPPAEVPIPLPQRASPSPPTPAAGSGAGTGESSEPVVPLLRIGRKIAGSQPPYPEESKPGREQGTVVLLVIVGTSGSVEEVSVAKSSGWPRLDRAALKAAKKWRWSPADYNGVPVRGQLNLSFTFTLPPV